MGAQGLEIRKDITAIVLRKKARREREGSVAVRMLGAASILAGMRRDKASGAAGKTRQTLRDRVKNYNAQGLDGSRDRPKGRPKRSLTPGQEAAIETLVTDKPEAVLVRWRCVDVQREIERRFQGATHERGVGKLLRRLGFHRMPVRPLHPEADIEAQQTFKKSSARRTRISCQIMPKTNHLSSGCPDSCPKTRGMTTFTMFRHVQAKSNKILILQ